ncbi:MULTISPECIES: hypothetical protein [unclassified Bradyrhizobium]|uniref:hypothetical protein n=1 Tax=Bradyrhizobium sp. USDA 4541 TaxID=2817704 RepID=UPI0020A3575E|nr:hypothetical protein [Bradyrhizobium sp. USDA 4541]MCP1852769.1 RNA binding exosome subunit [Bradyrhizobium sp. USDA 4541]
MGAAGTPEIVAQTLAGWGPAGAVIAVLLATIPVLAGAIVVLFKANNRLHIERKEELARFSKLVEANNAALTKVAESTEERNRVTEALAEAIKVQATAFEMVNQRIEFYHGNNIEKLKDLIGTFASQADAVRVLTGMVTLARDNSSVAATAATELKVKVDSIASKIDGALLRRPR